MSYNSIALSHSVNSSGRLGLFVNPHSCTCEGCHDSLGLRTLASPSPILERQSAVMSEPTSPIYVAQRTNGGGITPPPSLSTTPAPNWYTNFDQNFDENFDQTTTYPERFGYQEPTTTGLNGYLREEITQHLTDYLTMLEKHQRLVAAKLDLYDFLFEDASVRHRIEAMIKKIKLVKQTLGKLE